MHPERRWQNVGVRTGAGESYHVMARAQKLGGGGATDCAGGAKQQYARRLGFMGRRKHLGGQICMMSRIRPSP